MRIRFVSLLILLNFMFSAPALSDELGARLYDQHCSACHGATGEGGTGVPLALEDFQRQVTDDFLRKTIRHGRPGRVMPAFRQLSDKDIAAIVKHIRSFTNVEGVSESGVAIRGNPQHGKELFTQHCAACHGADGHGGKGTGVTFSRPRDLPILAPALNNAGFLASASDQMIKRTLMQGRKGTPMMSFLDRGLKESDIDDIVSYVRSFEKAQDAKAAPVEEPLTISYESSEPVEVVVENIKRAVQGKNFRLIRVQTLDDGFVDKDKESKKEVIVYFCNFQFLNEALAVDTRVGLFLPCRVTVFEREGKTIVTSINPKRLSKLFNNDELNLMCEQMYKLYNEILEEATL